MLDSARTPLAEALAWVDAHAATLGPDTVDLSVAGGRVLHGAILAPAGWPPQDCATADGHAVQAAGTEGAGEYSPMPLRPAPVAPGQAMPPGTDAVLPFADTDLLGRVPHATAPLQSGANVARHGSELAADAPAISARAVLGAPALAWLTLAGVSRVLVVRQPRVGLVTFGHEGPDALTPMLRALVQADGGIAEALPGEFGADWARAGRFDLVLLAGRSGEGATDDAPEALRHAGGTLDIHGVALLPGETVGLGRLNATPVVLLPGLPAWCLSAYAVLASRAVRRLAGLGPRPTVDASLTRRIASPLGYADWVPVRLQGGQATPLGGGLVAAMGADGHVLVPPGSEGMDIGATVAVHPTR